MKNEIAEIKWPGEANPQRIAYLVSKYVRQELTEIEHNELDDWITASNTNQHLFEELVDSRTIEQSPRPFKIINAENTLKQINERIKFTEELKAKQRARERKIQAVFITSFLLFAIIIVFLLRRG
jgi:hypothetical protein